MDKHRNRIKDVFMHFPGALLLSILIFGSSVTYLYISLGHYGQQDQLAYQKLVHGDEEAKKAGEAYTSKQYRQGLQKDIYFNEKTQRLHLYLQSADAELAFDKRDGDTDITEYMKDVKCRMQEELYFITLDGREARFQDDGRLLIKDADPMDQSSWLTPEAPGLIAMQKVLYLQAEKAIYYYNDDLFVAENVNLSRYVSLGHSLEKDHEPEKIVSNGTAKRVEFSLAGKGLNFKADHFKAKIFSMEGMR